ncbi:protein SPMIP1 [Pseudophryne corroboree]|uniref:protein SPMIP1 n=1 Tax=Pseudophryne corroboree TaxID=495146 RepID=UPI00308195B1
MARQFTLTTQKQECIKETYLKEIMTRINWRQRYAQTFPTIATFKAKPKLPPITGSSVHVTSDDKRSENIQQNVQTLKDLSKSDKVEATSVMNTQMKPVSPKTRSLLYNGTSKEEEGRYRYMKTRSHLKPEEKYLFPLATSWEYGWEIVNIDNNNWHRRCRIVTDTFYRKNGIPSEPSPRDMAL